MSKKKKKKSKFGDIDDIIEIVLNDNKTKLCIVSSSSFKNPRENMGRGKRRGRRFCFYF